MGRAAIRVLRGGLQTTVQDRGRFGYEALGVPQGGALDLPAYIWANRLAGNPEDAAVLEVTMRGPSLTLTEDRWIATTGASGLTIDGRPHPSWTGLLAPAGATVDVTGTVGARAYLAVQGGIEVECVLGSRSTDLSSGFGGLDGRALREGDELPLGNAPPLPYDRTAQLRHPFMPAAAVPPSQQENPLEVHVVLGPRDDAFSTEALAGFLRSTFAVTPQSDRMGLRLRGERIQGPPRGSHISEAMPVGGVQVPPDGQPIVLLNDRGTVGGYPLLATVIQADVWRLGQARPGDAVRFRAVSVQAGQALTRAALAQLRHFYPVLHRPPAGEEATQAPVAGREEAVHAVRAPSAGIFYRGKKPGAPPLVEPGDEVRPDTVVGLIEIMKTFEELVAGAAGRVREVQIEDGDVVEEGQAVMTIEPTRSGKEE